MAEVRKKEGKYSVPSDYATKVVTMGNVIELVSMEKWPFGSPCRKVDKDHYCDIRTGEVFEYEHIENRAGSLESIRQTLSKIRALINTNVTDPKKCRWITLTYAENMTDVKCLYQDYRKFWQRFCYWCDGQDIQKPEYITVQEPQGRGAWHVHAFFIWPGIAPFIPNDLIASLWRQGFTKTKALQDVDNIGAYFSAYLGDMPLDEVEKLSQKEQLSSISATGQIEEKEFSDEEGLKKVKKFVKGGRLFMYPPGMNIVRKTKGIKEPIVERMTYLDAKKKVSAVTETFSQAYEILNDSGRVVNVISKAYYNCKRNASQ